MEEITLKMRNRLRIASTAVDAEIVDNINTAKLDLERIGLSSASIDLEDELVFTACELYCKYMFNFEGEGESYLSRYQKFRDALSMSGGYYE